MERVVWLAVFVAVAGSSVWGQSITTDSNIETDGQLVSKVGSGTPPLAVSSNTTVRNLSADLLDGKHGNDFALYAELLAAIQSLDNPDPPCFSNTHRFVNCSNGTVTDGANGLIWLENAGCLGELDWAAASQAAALLFDGATIDSGGGDCGLSDGSRPGDWRLPTREEWEEIVAASCLGTGIPLVGNGSPDSGCYGDNAWATGVAPFTHWSSRTAVYNPTVATVAYVQGADFGDEDKPTSHYVWPVRTGHSQHKGFRAVACPADQFVIGVDFYGELVCTSISEP